MLYTVKHVCSVSVRKASLQTIQSSESTLLLGNNVAHVHLRHINVSMVSQMIQTLTKYLTKEQVPD